MKKISDFIPNKVIKKKENIDDLNQILKSSQRKPRDKVSVINYSDNSITIECENSSIASIIKFERKVPRSVQKLWYV